MGRPADSRDVRAAVHEETDGNPFFVEEVLGHLVDRGSVHRSRRRLGGACGARRPRRLPTACVTSCGGGPAGLTEGAQRLLAVAALMGREFDLDVVADVADVKEDEVLDAFEEAAAVGLVAEMPDAAGRYRFGHALIRLALEESTSAARRARLAPADRRGPRTSPARRPHGARASLRRGDDGRRGQGGRVRVRRGA